MGVNSDVLDDNAALCPNEKKQMVSGCWKMLGPLCLSLSLSILGGE